MSSLNSAWIENICALMGYEMEHFYLDIEEKLYRGHIFEK